MTHKMTLPVTGYRGEAVPNRFFQQDRATDHLAVILPGLGYHADLPLLHYSGQLLLHCGADVSVVDYAYHQNQAFRAAPETEQGRWLMAVVNAAWDAASSRRPYTRFTLLGKSLGTLATGQLVATRPELATARTVWLTPLLGNDRLVGQMQRHRGPSLIAIGTADRAYDAQALATIQGETGAKVIVVDGADHSLDLPGDVLGSLQVVERVVRALDWFIGP
jgi:dienelactone hydrolase